MALPDDSSLPFDSYRRVRKEAENFLQRADAFGRFPTPVGDLLEAGQITVGEDELTEGFLLRVRKKAGDALRRALSKVMGLFDALERVIFIDTSVAKVKQAFLKLHEAAHATLPHQRRLYAVVEDSEKELDPFVADLFDREANVFATEVLFQLDGFIREAEQHEFGLRTALKIGSKYGASKYAAIRQYVAKNRGPCVVLVLNPPVLAEGVGFRVELRRIVTSSSFRATYGELQLPQVFTPDDSIGAMVPVGGRRMSARRNLTFLDQAGRIHKWVAEAFQTPYQVFVLAMPASHTRTDGPLSSAGRHRKGPVCL